MNKTAMDVVAEFGVCKTQMTKNQSVILSVS